MSPSSVADLELPDNVRVRAEGRIGLDVHLPGAAEAVEVVDVVAAQVRLERVKDIAQLHAHRLDFGPVDIDVELRRAGAEAVEQADEAGLLVALGDQVVRLGLERVEINVAGRLHHQLEAAGVAQAPHRWRPEDEHASLRDLPLQALAELGRNGLAAQRRVMALVERREDDEHGTVVRAEGVQDERLPGDGHRVSNPGSLEGDLLDRLSHLGSALQRGGVGQLDVHQQVALVLGGDEPGWGRE